VTPDFIPELLHTEHDSTLHWRTLRGAPRFRRWVLHTRARALDRVLRVGQKVIVEACQPINSRRDEGGRLPRGDSGSPPPVPPGPPATATVVPVATRRQPPWCETGGLGS
jgi:hypothetical protein